MQIQKSLACIGLPHYVMLNRDSLLNQETGNLLDLKNKKRVELFSKGNFVKAISNPLKLWDVIEQHPSNVYTPSDLRDGSLIGFPGYLVIRNGKIYSKRNLLYLSQFLHETGYYKVTMAATNGVIMCVLVHRIIAMSFLDGRTPSTDIVNHKDTNRSNNHASNLEWGSYDSNMQHASISERWIKNTPIEVVIDICDRLEKGHRVCDITRDLKLARNVVSNIRRRITYAYVSSSYTF